MMFWCDFNNKMCEGTVYMTEDTSILFKNSKGPDFSLDYTISLGDSHRYLMDVSCRTGRCGMLRFFMMGIKVTQKELKIPKSKKGELYFRSKEEMTEYWGTIYMNFEDGCFYDEKNNVLCVGNPDQKGKTVEFLTNTYAVVNGNDLVALYIKVKYLQENIMIQKGRFQNKKEFKNLGR